jgi:hypothetical protein
MKLIQSIALFLSLTPVVFLSIGQETNDIKTRQRIEKRFIHPESKYITISGGWAFTSTYTNDPNSFLKTGLVMMNNHIFPNVRYEHSIGENTFLETSYEFGKVGINMGRKMTEEISWDKYSRFSKDHNNHILQIGCGYRIIGKNKFHFLNLHTGLFFGVSNKTQSDIQSFLNHSATYIVEEPETGLSYQIERNIESYSRYSFGAYLGASHEIRLSDRLRFVIRYTHRFGLNPILSGKYVFSDNLNLDSDATFDVRGGGAFISGGLKILLSKLNNPNNE